jgi:peroxiredoxin
MATEAVDAELGSRAPDFALPGACGQTWSRDDALGPHGLLVMFICNHCPYVQAVLDRIVRDARELQALGVGVVAISSNDAVAYPEDSFEAMQRLWRDRQLPFPYLYDADQSVARGYGAVCTPDFYGYDRDLRLRYHGRLDASGRQPAPPGARRELFEAMKQVALGRPVPDQQTPSIGCSIKWKAATGPA